MQKLFAPRQLVRLLITLSQKLVRGFPLGGCGGLEEKIFEGCGKVIDQCGQFQTGVGGDS